MTNLLDIPKSWCHPWAHCDEKFIPEFKLTIDDEGLASFSNDGRLVCVKESM